MSYTHNTGFSATASGFAVQINGVDTQVIGADGAITLPAGKALAGSQDGAVLGSVSIEKADNYALAAADKAHLVFLLKNTGSSKTFTLGLAAGQVAFVYNFGSETFTLKNVAADDGTSAATTKAFLVVGSATTNGSTVIALN